MELDDPVRDAVRRYRLSALPHQLEGTAGARTGRRPGTSVDFIDYRSYVPGDDLRHVDWSVYARTGELTVRLHQQEVRPRVDVLLDTSRSMGVQDGSKATLARQLALFAQRSAIAQGMTGTLHQLGEQAHRTGERTPIELSAASSVLFSRPEHIASQLARGGVRLVISDFLVPFDPKRSLRALSSGASLLVVAMLLGPWEANPDAAGVATLVDAETGSERALSLSAATLTRYRRRLAAVRRELRTSCEGLAAPLVEVICDGSLDAVLRRDWLPLALVRPA
jgi:uncharacterized protein (DUF58 family)